MPKALEEIAKDAMELSLHQRLALAGFLLGSAGSATDIEADSAWNSEIRERISAIDEGRAVGIPYEDVMRTAESRSKS